MASPVPHHRHQASLESIIDLTQPAPLSPAQRANARRILYQLVECFEALDNVRSSRFSYIYPRLVRYTYEYSVSEESRDIFLRAFLNAMALGLDDETDSDFESLKPLFDGFAGYLLDNFFLPLKASTRRTPQPSPAHRSAVLRAQANDALAFVGTPERLSSLRGACLVRDRHRCVITRTFDSAEYPKRFQQDGVNARDDNGDLFTDDDASRQAALAILNMFDLGVAHTINGVDIDRPRNALTLTADLHDAFGGFNVYFDHVSEAYHTYWIRSFLPPRMNQLYGIPVQRELFVRGTHIIDPPSPRLLAVHRAIAHILHLSGAGDYIDAVLRDLEYGIVRADGSSELGQMVSLVLGNWATGTVSG
ncbi:hypothetical protein SPI_08450 [Niveomyces insectorum RCEF 264]|uniref:HNH nuclease domain-containing protein n=1 Tax=Niveomyces insectorum RCEF 264 TaxID=1081102 RepID=A0A162ICW2_9HYPO|nr:hypothetical protein SPI_08450 [Niveomyces insectorum RCEF 264]